jgi:citrate synthase
MGFGHRVYRTEDPRARSLKAVALEIGGERAQLALAVEAAAEATLAELKPGRALHPNVEFWAAVVLEACAIPRTLFTATFCCSRIVGWTAHALEQLADNRIMRPTANYTGALPPA